MLRAYLAADTLLEEEGADVGEAEANPVRNGLARVPTVKEGVWRRHHPAKPRHLRNDPSQ